jgi:hypothetical protein
MNVGEFWQLVDGTIGHEDRLERLVQLLAGYAPEHIVRFRLHYDDAMQAANTVDLRGAAHVIHGGCDDDAFFDFREALIELGQATFVKVVAQPDALASIAVPGTPLFATEGLSVAAANAWTAKTGQTEDDFFAEVDRVDTTDRATPETGDWWNFNDPDEVRHRLPQLAATFLPHE